MDMVDFVWVWWMVGVGGVGDVERRLIMGVERDRWRGIARAKVLPVPVQKLRAAIPRQRSGR